MKVLPVAYEVYNPALNDLDLTQQIEHGVNDWAAEGYSGHLYYRRTVEEAEVTRMVYLCV